MSERSRLRLVVLGVLVMSLLGTLVGRLWFLQVGQADQYAEAASNTALREVITPAPRGLILDAMGRPLAANRTALVVSVSRAALARQPDGGRALVARVAEVIREPFATVWGRTRLCGEADAPRPPDCWNGSPFQPIPVTDTASTGMALQIMENQERFPGVTAEVTTVRHYPMPRGANAAHVLGYLGPVTDAELAKAKHRPGTQTTLQRTDLVGRSGLEATYDAELRGRPGVRTVSIDRRNLVTGVVSEQQPVPGNYLVTSIDARVQASAERALAEAMHQARTTGDPNKGGARYAADSGAAVVMEVDTGRIVAMASAPSYNPNIWVGGISQKQYDAITSEANNYPNISRAYQGQFAPGSTFKLVSVPAAAKAGYSLDASYDCPSAYRIGDSMMHNYESAAYGVIPFTRAIQVSCDTVFYKFAYETWLAQGGNNAPRDTPDPFVQMAKAFGLGRPTGLDLPGEAGGRIPDRQWKYDYWKATRGYNCAMAKDGYKDLRRTDPQRAAYLTALARENCSPQGYVYRGGDEANFAIGQGDVTVTPLQLARAYAAVANGGTLYVPTVGKAIMRPDGTVVREIRPKVAGRLPIPARTLHWMQRTFATVTEPGGTGYAPFANAGFPLDQIRVAAKTGTAEVYGKQSTSWFAAWAPAGGAKPQYAVVMMVSQGGTGSGVSGPGVEKIFETLFGISDGRVHLARAAPPYGRPVSGLPRVTRDGDILPPVVTR